MIVVVVVVVVVVVAVGVVVAIAVTVVVVKFLLTRGVDMPPMLNKRLQMSAQNERFSLLSSLLEVRTGVTSTTQGGEEVRTLVTQYREERRSGQG